ncbi:MAG TPA: amidohydrolase family protein, partial [Planctomycetota bacterium]|nr:amidohydrolase family protein [Planctomycetota bacterium]
ETEYLAHGYSGLNMFAHYIQGDLASAGMDPAFVASMREDTTSPVSAWWPKLKPWWEVVKHTSYSRALRVTARDLFGIDAINDDTIADFAAKVKADNTPGLYRRVLQERCNIRLSITCVGRADLSADPNLRQITAMPNMWGFTCADLRKASEWAGREMRSLDDLVGTQRAILKKDLADGAVGFKTVVHAVGVPDRKAAEAEFTEALRTTDEKRFDRLTALSEVEGRVFPALRDLVFDACLDVAAEAKVPVAVHTGYWGDFRTLDPKLLFDFVVRRRDVHFDMFHLGHPMLRDAAVIAKTQPNVSANLCWLAVISPVQTARMLDELIDLVPVNKITAFGGDYRVCVQKVYGHLVLAREVVASVLAKRIEAGDFDRAEAMRLARMWFIDNPTRIYRLRA